MNVVYRAPTGTPDVKVGVPLTVSDTVIDVTEQYCERRDGRGGARRTDAIAKPVSTMGPPPRPLSLLSLLSSAARCHTLFRLKDMKGWAWYVMVEYGDDEPIENDDLELMTPSVVAVVHGLPVQAELSTQ